MSLPNDSVFLLAYRKGPTSPDNLVFVQCPAGMTFSADLLMNGPTATSLAAVALTGSYADLASLPNLGSAATQSASAFGTAAQGAKADSAVQSGVAPLSVTGTAMSLAAATGASAGSMSSTDKSKLDSLASWTFGSPINATRIIQTVAAAANGWQLSATRNATVTYSVSITTTTSIGGPSSGSIVLEICPTNSATAASWITVNAVAASQTATLAVVLQLVSVNTQSVFGIVPAGYYARIRSTSPTGTVSYGYVSGQEILQ